MPAAIEAVEEAFRRLASGDATNTPRRRDQGSGFVLHSMSASASYLGFAGWKHYVTTKSGAKFYVGLQRTSDGSLAALIEADRLGQMRTGAVTAVAVKHLTEPTADEMGLFGSGWQAESQLLAVAAVRPLKRVYVYSRRPESRNNFARRLTEQIGVEVLAVDEPRRAVENLPIVVTATTSKTPVFDGGFLSSQTLVCAMGSNWLQKAEIDVSTVARANTVVCDSIEACQLEAGDFLAAIEQGKFAWSSAMELSAIVADGRRQPSRGVTIFKSVGMAIEDVAVAAMLLEQAERAGIGTLRS